MMKSFKSTYMRGVGVFFAAVLIFGMAASAAYADMGEDMGGEGELSFVSDTSQMFYADFLMKDGDYLGAAKGVCALNR